VRVELAFRPASRLPYLTSELALASGTEMARSMDCEITPEELKSLLESSSDVVILDVRELWEIETAEMARSKHIPMNEIPARFQCELDPGKHIVVVCHHGVRSYNVTAWLRQQGYDKVQSLAGGIDRWARQMDPKVPVY